MSTRTSWVGGRVILAPGVKLTRSDGPPRTLRMLAGDNCEIEIV